MSDMYDTEEMLGDYWSDRHNQRCKYCGTGNLTWVSNRGKWRLIAENGEFHRCPGKRKDAV